MWIEVTEGGEIVCGWFALCLNTADGYVPHPVLGPVPTCRDCADKCELDLVECELAFESEEQCN